MAIIQGTSVLGLQLTDVSQPPESGRFAIDFGGTIPPSRLLRVGTVLACHRIPAPTRFRVVRAYKLYGHGMLAESPINLVQTPIDLELWVRWFVPGLLWTVQFF